MMRMIIITLILVLTNQLCFSQSTPQNRDFYQIKVYHFKTDVQEQRMDKYLKDALVPALHRIGISDVGVFKTMTNEGGQRAFYVLIPYGTPEVFFEIEQKLEEDPLYQKEGKDYLEAQYDKPPYERIETILLSAFEKHPNYKVPKLSSSPEKRVYELRSYESATEQIFKNKVKMFNDGDEIGLFERLGFNAVFYGEVIAGSHMPNLMYMTSFEDQASRDQHWESFGKDPFWKELSADPEYQNNVSHIDIIFLRATAYSDL